MCYFLLPTETDIKMPELQLIAQATRHGDSTAVIASGESYTYNQILASSATLAGRLLDGDHDLNEARVAYLIPPGFEYVVTQWAIWRAGGIALPLSLSATEPELEYALTDSEVATVVVVASAVPSVQGLCDRHGLKLLNVGSDATITPPPALPEVTPSRRAMILYTSGTTNKPKGVVTTHATIQAQIRTLVEAWHWQEDDTIPLFLPLHHIHGIINIMSCALWTGATVEAFPAFHMTTILNRIADNAYSVFMAVPTIYVKLIQHLSSLSPDDRKPVVDGFAAMRLMISGSAALPASVHQQWTALTGQKLLERYGMTEIGMGLSNPYAAERRPGMVGQPLPGVDIRLKSETGDIVEAEGESGEIQVRGPNVFSEYYNRPKVTPQSFDDGWFRTGDIAVVEDGYYRIMGRLSVDIIKSGGYKLSALEIEATLLQHDLICECAVVGVLDDTWGEIVAAAVVLEDGQYLNLDDLTAWCGACLSKYKTPRRLLVVDCLPRNAMGKVTKPDVKKLFTC